MADRRWVKITNDIITNDIIQSRIISTDEDPSLRIESSAIINLRGVSTKLNKYIVFTMQTYKKLISFCCKGKLIDFHAFIFLAPRSLERFLWVAAHARVTTML